MSTLPPAHSSTAYGWLSLRGEQDRRSYGSDDARAAANERALAVWRPASLRGADSVCYVEAIKEYTRGPYGAQVRVSVWLFSDASGRFVASGLAGWVDHGEYPRTLLPLGILPRHLGGLWVARRDLTHVHEYTLVEPTRAGVRVVVTTSEFRVG